MKKVIDKLALLKKVNVGSWIAEEEGNELESYFVETNQWSDFFSGRYDIIYGPKGSGKSAYYVSLLKKQSELARNKIFVIPAENMRGDVIFKNINLDPPPSEKDFEHLWELYFLIIIGQYFLKSNIADDIVKILKNEHLIDESFSLPQLLSSARNYIKGLMNPEGLESTLKVNEATGVPSGISLKVLFRDPTPKEKGAGITSVDNLLKRCDFELKNRDKFLWIALDRLDVAFAENPNLEENALRSLFRVYLNFFSFENIKIKLFLRTDIWNRITKKGFREASHITRFTTIKWSSEDLIDMIIKRLSRPIEIKEYYGISDVNSMTAILKHKLFYRMLPKGIEGTVRKPDTLKWMVSRTQDASNEASPRELIHLLSASREEQIRRLELGHKKPPQETLFENVSIKKALAVVSKVKIEQTLYAEYPNLKSFIIKLENEHSEQNIETLCKLWNINQEEASKIAERLVEVGFFLKKGTKTNPSYWVPFIYRSTLKLIQGSSFKKRKQIKHSKK
ncbi:MAG TPA: hypothetical protein P5295_17290 [Spirochaetota bacterium]|nr:hypothetical protein [Spirochaetota bacterium]